MGARFYDPTTGTLLQTDPVSGSTDSPLSMVPYIYGLNDPVNLIDPNGEVPNEEWFDSKTRMWKNSAQTIQTFLHSLGFLGKDGRQLTIDGKYEPNTRRAHENYFFFRDAIGNPYKGSMKDSSYLILFSESSKMEMKRWFAGKGESVKHLQNLLYNRKLLAGKYVTGYYGAITDSALRDYMYSDRGVTNYTPVKAKIVIIDIDTKSQPPNDTGFKPPKNPDKGKQRVRAPGGKGETGWLDKSGNVWVPDLDMDGGEGWRRHYPDGSHDHVYPGGKVRTHDAGVTAGDVAKGAVVVGGGYLIYRGIRMLPSLIPVLWSTIPANLVCP